MTALGQDLPYHTLRTTDYRGADDCIISFSLNGHNQLDNGKPKFENGSEINFWLTTVFKVVINNCPKHFHSTIDAVC